MTKKFNDLVKKTMTPAAIKRAKEKADRTLQIFAALDKIEEKVIGFVYEDSHGHLGVRFIDSTDVESKK